MTVIIRSDLEPYQRATGEAAYYVETVCNVGTCSAPSGRIYKVTEEMPTVPPGWRIGMRGMVIQAYCPEHKHLFRGARLRSGIRAGRPG